jgi:phosphopantetheinyl transferase (holo-ACP synthase)
MEANASVETFERYRIDDEPNLGKPYLRLWRGMQGTDYPLSISHDQDYVVAVVINAPIAQSESISLQQSTRTT